MYIYARIYVDMCIYKYIYARMYVDLCIYQTVVIIV